MSLRDAWDDAAGEWLAWSRTPGHDSYWKFHGAAFLRLAPAAGRLTVDIGCGEGRVGRDLATAGHRVVGVDASWTLAHAAARHPDAGGAVVVGDAASLPLRSDVADLAVAFMSLQDVDDFAAAIAEASRVLSDDGVFVMAITHPLNTAGSFLEDDGDAHPAFVITDSWFEPRRTHDQVVREGLAMTFHSEHRSLQAYADALADAGFLIERIVEVADPDPDDRWHRLPLFLHVRAVKAASGPFRA